MLHFGPLWNSSQKLHSCLKQNYIQAALLSTTDATWMLFVLEHNSRSRPLQMWLHNQAAVIFSLLQRQWRLRMKEFNGSKLSFMEYQTFKAGMSCIRDCRS